MACCMLAGLGLQFGLGGLGEGCRGSSQERALGSATSSAAREGALRSELCNQDLPLATRFAFSTITCSDQVKS